MSCCGREIRASVRVLIDDLIDRRERPGMGCRYLAEVFRAIQYVSPGDGEAIAEFESKKLEAEIIR